MTAARPDPLASIDLQADPREARARRGTPSDTDRILALPRRDPSPADLDALRARWTAALRRPSPTPHDDPRGDPPGLLADQALLLDDLDRAAAVPGLGAVNGSPVGGGKTLAALLAPAALAVAGAPARRVVALVPASLRGTWDREVDRWARWWPVGPVRHHAPGDPDPAGAPGAGWPGVVVVSHETLSSPRGAGALDDLRPDLVIVDECHAFGRLGSARTKRLIRYAQTQPLTRFVLLTGTLASTSVRDYAHLLELALRDGSPVPTEPGLLAQWGAVLDPDGEPIRADWEAVWPVVRAGRRIDPGPLAWDHRRIPHGDRREVARLGVGRWARCTPGLVLARGGGYGGTLVGRYHRPPPPPPSVAEALGALEGRWVLPDGSEIVDALEIDRARRSLALGWWSRWAWPGGEPDTDWLDARRAWSGAVRAVIEYSGGPGWDSPALVAEAVDAGRGSASLRAAREAWLAVRDRYGPTGPPSEVVWLDGARAWLVGALRAWLEEAVQRHRDALGPQAPGALVWYTSRAVEGAVAAALGAGGAVYGAGSAPPDPDGPQRFVGISGNVHAEGANLQTSVDGRGGWSLSLVVEPRASARWWEQAIGRTHRPGQRAGAVRVEIFTPPGRGGWVARRAVERAIARADYLATVQGAPQKLGLVTWE